MKNLAFVVALLAITAGLAMLALRLLRRAEDAHRSALSWLAALLGTWLGVLALTALGTRAVYEKHYHAAPGFWTVFGPAVGLAFAAAFLLTWRLSRQPRRAARQSSTPQDSQPAAPAAKPRETPSLAPAPHPPAVTTFKFACPHCGQRLAVTTAEIGTTANCPNCEALLEVPAPPLALEPG